MRKWKGFSHLLFICLLSLTLGVIFTFPLCFPLPHHQSRPNHVSVLAERQGQPVIKGIGVALITHRPTCCKAQSTLTKMSEGALRLCLLALQLRCVTLLAIPRRDGSDESQRDAPLHLRDLPRGPEVAPHKKAPQFMLDLFNAVSVTDGTPKSQKDILEGNIVRSFEDKGERSPSVYYLHVRADCFVRIYWVKLSLVKL